MPVNENYSIDTLSLAAKEQIYAERVKFLYDFFYIRWIGLISASVIIAYLVGDVAEQKYVIRWLSFGTIILIGRISLHLIFKKYSPKTNEMKVWANAFIASMLITGIYFGSIAFVLFSIESIPHIAGIVALIVAYTAGIMNSVTSFPIAFKMFSFFSLFPYTIGFFIQQSEISILFGVGIIFAVYLINGIVKGNYNSYINNIILRFEFEKQKEIAEQANIEKSKFLAAASHDLRQPLFSLELYSSILESKLKESGTKEILSKMSLSIDSLISLFNALLDISKLDAGTVQPEKSHFLVNEVLHRLEAEYKPQIIKKGISWTLDSCDAAIHTDPVLLETILRNIISNAIRYTSAGEIKLACYKSSDMIKIDIIDTGIGIAKNEIDQIFSEYYQIGNPERDRTKGLGLGLSIVNRLTTLLGIGIVLDSEENKGTCVSLFFKKEESNKILEDDLQSESIEINCSTNKHILIVDDEEMILAGLRDLLTEWGYDVTAASSKADAENQLKNKTMPNIIITDYRLREGQTGVDVIKAIQLMYQKNIPTLIITGDTSPDRLIELENSGHPVLHKPVKPARLRTFLIKLLGRIPNAD